MDKEKLLRTFNRASILLYGAGKGLQKGTAWLEAQGIHAYSVMPTANRFIRHHAADFFGPYALAHVASTFMPKPLERWRHEIGAVFSMAAGTAWEMRHIHDRFDWMDMGCYAAATLLYYALNREHQAQPAVSAPAKMSPT